MHLLDVARGFYGGWGIVAGQLPVATGLALGLVRQEPARRGPLRAGRRRGEHGRLARVAEPRRGLVAADRLPGDQQRLRHGHGGRPRVGRPGAVPPRRRLRDRRRARRRQRPRGRHRSDRRAAHHAHARSAARRARADDLPLPRPLGRRRRSRLPHEGGDRRSHGPRRPDRPRPRLGCSTSERPRPSSTRSTRSPTRRSPTRSTPPKRAPSPTLGALASGMYATGSAQQFARMLPGSPFGERELIFAGGLGA